MTQHDGIYSKKFHSNQLTEQKYGELKDVAVMLRDKRNELSKFLCQNLEHYLEYGKFDFVTEMRTKNFGVPSSYDKHLFEDVFVAFQNKFDSIKRRLEFEAVRFEGFEFYKRDTKDHKKGDLKKVKVKREDTPLSTCLTYLARYGNDGTLDYINKQLPTCDDKKRKFYENILHYCDKFGFDRLFKLAKSRRDRTFNHYAEHPIEFKSLSFRGRSRKTRIIDYNSKFGSVINSFVSLSGVGRKSFDIPVKFNKDYHGSMKDYRKANPDYEYTVTFDERNKQVCIILTKRMDRYVPDAGDSVIGIDVNCKHNLFALSDGTTYDYDRKLVNDYCKLLLVVDDFKKDKSYKVGKRKQQKLDVMKVKIIKSEQQMIASMCKTLQAQGVNHIVMEDLDNGFGKCYAKDADNEDINYNRKVKFLALSSLKDEVEHIARKYDIAVSTVHASYTSKMCPVCGCIEDENRPSQETFQCVECGHKNNADLNAAINIRNRVTVTVLRDKLLKRLDNGAYEPKKLKRDKVKDVLLSYRTSLQKKAGNVSKPC